MKLSHVQIILLSLLFVSCAGAPVNAQADEPDFAITTKNDDDQVKVQVENEAAVIDIQSPTGIGAGTFRLKSGVMPGEVILRLHLKGLEQLRLSSNAETIGASVSSGEAPVIRQTILSSGTEAPILPGNPLWMEIQIVSSQEGYFEIRVPQEFLQKAGTSFTVEWIDSYR